MGIITIVLTGLFTGYYWGGFAWRSDPGLQFNWHPLLMSIGMIYLYGNGMFLNLLSTFFLINFAIVFYIALIGFSQFLNRLSS